MSVMTLRSLESGGAGGTMGAYVSVMHVLGLEQDLNKVGALDDLGRHLQDAQLTRASTARTKRPERERSVIASESVISTRISGLNASDALLFPLNTHSLSALLVSKKEPAPNA